MPLVDQSLHPIKDGVCSEHYEASLKELFSSGNEAKHGEAVGERETNQRAAKTQLWRI